MLSGNPGKTLGIDKPFLVPSCRAGAAGSWQALGGCTVQSSCSLLSSQALGPHTLPLPGGEKKAVPKLLLWSQQESVSQEKEPGLVFVFLKTELVSKPLSWNQLFY